MFSIFYLFVLFAAFLIDHDRHRRDAAAERLSVRILHACRMPRAARRARTDLADRDDGAGGGIRIRCESAASLAVLLFVLARARHRLGRSIHGGLSDGGESMFVTDFAGSVYSARLDGSGERNFLYAQGNLTGIAYAEI